MKIVMLEMAKLPRDKRERVIRLCAEGKCLKCEEKPQQARGRCAGCLNEVYGPLRWMKSALDKAKFLHRFIRQGTLLEPYEKTYPKLKRQQQAPSMTSDPTVPYQSTTKTA